MVKSRSRRLDGLAQSDIRRMTRESERLGAINLGQGLCDLPTPPAVAEAAKAAIDAGKSQYSYPEGTRELRQAIAAKLARDNGITADPDTEIVVTAGASGAFAALVLGLLDPGDGILLFEPYYGYHLNAALALGLEAQFLTLHPPGFEFDEDALRAAVRDNTRAIIVCTPSNPSGAMYTRAELEIIDRVARDRDLLVITDEMYEYFCYDREHISPATVGDLASRTVSLMGLSKTFSITGWRLGYAVAPAALARPMMLANDLLYVCAPTPLQYGGAAGFGLPASYFQSIQTVFCRRRDMLADALDAAGLSPIVPQGAYYMLADVSSLGCATALDAAMTVLERARVASVPGTAFYRGEPGERLLRFNFAKEDDVLAEACRRLRQLG